LVAIHLPHLVYNGGRPGQGVSRARTRHRLRIAARSSFGSAALA
jgi:hypothetical protein